MLRVIKLSLIGIIGLGLVACGKTDPAQDFSNLPTRPFENNNYRQLSGATPTPLFSISLLGSSDVNFANLYEGEQGSIKFSVTPLFPQITGARVSSPNLPSRAQLSQATEPNTWVLTWTPPVGTVPENTSSVSKTVHIDVFPVTNDKRIANHNTPLDDLKFTVTKTRAIPVIKGIDGWKNEIDEGKYFEFTVRIYDPASTLASTDLSLEKKAFDSGINKENFKLDLNDYTPAKTVGSLQDDKNGNWSRTYYVDLTRGLTTIPGQIPTGLNSIEGCITFQAESAFGNKSNPASKCTIINIQAESPDLVINDSPYDYQPLEFQAGKPATITIVGSIKNKQGVASIINNTPGFAKWPGNPHMDQCQNGDNNDMTVQKCTITWQIPCKTGSKYTLNLAAENTKAIVNGSPRTNKVSKQINVAPADAGCVDPTQVAPAVSKPAVATATEPVKPVAKRASGQSVGAVAANSTVAPDTKLSPDLKEKSASFAVKTPKPKPRIPMADKTHTVKSDSTKTDSTDSSSATNSTTPAPASSGGPQ